MNSTLVRLSILCVVAASLFTACKNSSFDTDKNTGIEYKFFKHNETGNKPALGDVAIVELVAHGTTNAAADTELFNSMKNPRNPKDTNKTFPIRLQKLYNGSLLDAIGMMAIGDSGAFKINADSFFIRMAGGPVPKNLKPAAPLVFYMKLVDFKTPQQLQQMQMEEMGKHRTMEIQNITKYLADNHYDKFKPTNDSLIYLERSGGKGEQVKEGDSLYVTYSGALLNGKVFDASELHPGQAPLKFVYTTAGGFIRGWLIALGTMHEGEKIKILVPFSLAYGPQQRSADILPFSTLVFDMQVIKIKHNKTAPQAPAMMMPPPKMK